MTEFPEDPRGRELILMIERAKYERWLSNEVAEILHRAFDEVIDTILSPAFRTLSQFEQARKLQLFRELDHQLRNHYIGASNTVVAEMRGYAQLEGEVAAAQIRSMLTSATSERVAAGVGAMLSRQAVISIATLPIEGLNIGEWFEAQAAGMSRETRRLIQNGLLQGKSIPEMVKSIMPPRSSTEPALYRRARIEAMSITRTTVNTVQNHAALESYRAAGNDVSDSFRIVAVRDARTTPICFTGATRVAPLGRLRKVFRRRYHGDVLIITTAAGEEIETTPNHPILTADGWLPAKEIKPRQHIVYACPTYGLGIGCADEIGVPPTFAEIANALFDPAFSQIEIDRAATEDFHGDGMGGEEEVHVAVVDSDLGARLDLLGLEHVGNDALSWLHRAGCFGTETSGGSLGRGGAPIVQSAKRYASLAQNFVQPAFGSAQLQENRAGSLACDEESNGALGVISGVGLSLATGDVRHHSQILQQVSNGGGARTELPCQARSGSPAPVSARYVIRVRRERTSTHVFNLETDLGIYIAGRLLVKNCRKLDGLVQRNDNPKAMRPPFHFRCRTGVVPIVRAEFLPRADQMAPLTFGSYGEWLRGQSASQQDAILGPQRASWWRDGRMTLADAVDDDNRVLTLAQLRKRLPIDDTPRVPAFSGAL